MSATHKKPRVAAGRGKNAASARISLQVPERMKAILQDIADVEKRTLNAQCELLLEQGLKAREAA